jgi:uncharacterized repeat protein (TIGR03803 family)
LVIHVNDQTDTAGAHTLIQNPGDGLYYGAAQGGGAHYPAGSVFKMDTSGNVTLIYSFLGGTTDGRLPTTAVFLNDDGMLYGNTFNGGPDDAGGVFKMDTSGGSYVFAAQAVCGATGDNPSGSFFKANDGNFYMPTMGCAGPNLLGTIDELNTSLSETEVANFNINSGTFWQPQGHLLQGADSMLYGTAPEMPNIAGNRGGVYRIPLGGGDVETVHNFALGEGICTSVSAPLLLASDGNFWGTTMETTDLQGSVLFTGTIFKVAEDGTFQVMHYFNGDDGRFPITGLIQASDGYLYGATEAGGAVDYGVIYRIDLDGNYAKLANIYDVNIGAGPWSELLEGSDGRLYGTTQTGGGPLGFGTIYTVDFTQNIVDIVPSDGNSAGGDAVTIDGTGFVNGATVKIDINDATNVSVPDATHVDATTPPANAAGSIVNVRVILPDTTVIVLNNGFFYDFLDVPAGDIFEPYVRKLVANGVTAGCGGGDYCRNNPVLRKQMAVFALKAKNGSGYVPPPAVGIFTDVPASDPFAPWIEELHNLGVVTGCAPGPMYCPDSPVLRQQMPVFLLKTLEGSGYVPPMCTGLFADVPCPSLFANWIEDVANRGIAGGCGGGDFCPMNPTTRGQMAPFLVKTFQLP